MQYINSASPIGQNFYHSVSTDLEVHVLVARWLELGFAEGHSNI